MLAPNQTPTRQLREQGLSTDLQDLVCALLKNAQVLHHVAFADPPLAQEAAHSRGPTTRLLKHVADALLHTAAAAASVIP